MSSTALLRLFVGLYLALFFAYLFLPLVFMAAAAFNDSRFPTMVPWQGFTLRWFDSAPNTAWFLPSPYPNAQQPIHQGVYDGPGIVPEGASTLQICMVFDPPTVNEGYKITLYHPLHPDAPAL
jgi:hypothetical protein